MMNARVMVAGVWFAAWCSIPACGGGSDEGDSETTTRSNTPAQSNTPAPGNQTGGTGCVPASCPSLTLFGSPASGCCQMNGDCGGTVVVMNSSVCAPPDIEELANQLAAPFEQLEEEEIVTTEECPGLPFQGTTIPGCCDATGVCGVSTASFADNPNNTLPFNIPVTCISAAEASAIGLAPASAGVDAGAPIACGTGN